MKIWRIVAVLLVLALLVTGLYFGPGIVGLPLFLLFLLGVPAALALRFLRLRASWVYMLGCALSSLLAMERVISPDTPTLYGVLTTVLIGAALGFGWKTVLNLGPYPMGRDRGDGPPPGTTMTPWIGG